MTQEAAAGGTTSEEWETELRRCGAVGEGDAGETALELSRRHQISLRRMQRLLRDKVDAGTVVQLFGYRFDNAGRRQRVPVYQLAKEK